MAKSWLCKIGLHDWEAIGFQGLYWHKINLVDEVCLRCGKKNLRLTNYRNSNRERTNLANEITRKNM